MKVKFLPQNIEIEIKPNQSVMNLAHENNLPIHSVCNGMPSCAECRIKLVEGEYNVTPPSRKELNLIGTGYFIDQRRLACQLYCFGDITVDLTEQLEKLNEGPVPKKFLARANKENVEDYHSVGGVLLEQDEALVKQAEKEAGAQAEARPRAEGPRNSQAAQHQRQSHPQQNQQNRNGRPHRGGSQEGGEGRGRRRRRRR